MRLLLATFLFPIPFLFNSCGEFEEPIPNEALSSVDYMPMTAGSWWAYVNIWRVEGEPPSVVGRDTIRVIGDTVINGEVYAGFTGKLTYHESLGFFAVRDSSFHLVRDNGYLLLPYHNFTDTFDYDENEQLQIYGFRKLFEDSVITEVPAGQFQTIDFRKQIFRGTVGEQFCTDHPVGYWHFQFSEGIGLVRSTSWYTTSGPCYTVSKELEAYHIE